MPAYIGARRTSGFLGATGLGVLGLAAAMATAAAGNPHTAGVMASPPMVAIGTTAPTGITTQYPSTFTVAAWQAAVDMDGGLPFSIGGKLYLHSTGASGTAVNWTTGTNTTAVSTRITVVHTGTDFAFTTLDLNGTPYNFRILVNGQYASLAGYQTAGSGAGQYVTVTFASSATRIITLELNGGMSLNYLYRRSTDTFAKAAIVKPTILFVGDSISAGAINDQTTGISATGSANKFNGDSIARRVADILGVKAIIDAIGGTGYEAGTAGATWFKDRLLPAGGNDLNALVPLVDGVVFLVGINDVIGINNTTLTRASFQYRTATDFAQIASTYPNVPIAVGGNYYNSSLVGAGAVPTGVNPNTEADVAAAVAFAKAQVPSARIGFFRLNDLINGSGSVGAPAGNGNADTVLNADRTHPCTAGEIAMAPLVAARAAGCLLLL